jgi:RNA polymerase sigma factor (sigma-70 family)
VQSGKIAATDVTMKDTSMQNNILQAARSTDRRSSVPPHSDLEQMLTRHIDPVYRFLYRHVGNREDAEDLTSQVFLKASRHLNAQAPQASRAQCLLTVARAVLGDHWRRYYRAGTILPLDHHRIEEPNPRDGESPPVGGAQRVQEVLDGLPERYRRGLELRFVRGYSIQEIAQEMGLTPETVKVVQHRALAKAVQASKDHQ